ncbi:hypothetical protein ACRRTK_003501 [Alexandromys fortis]
MPVSSVPSRNRQLRFNAVATEAVSLDSGISPWVFQASTQVSHTYTYLSQSWEVEHAGRAVCH